MLSLDAISLGAPEVHAADVFYKTVFSPTATDYGRYVRLDMHGTGTLALYGTDVLAADAHTEPATSGFRGYLVSYIVSQPTEVEVLMDAAVHSGATVLKPAKKSLFGAFSAVFQAPDGAIWKLSAPTKKDTGPAGDPPRPTETGLLLGVTEPKASKGFYAALGMTTDRAYGNKYIDFRPATGACRLGLMPRQVIAKDAGVDQDGAGFRAAVFHCRVHSRAEVDAVLTTAVSAGGQLAVAVGENDEGGYSGHFTDPDGFLWKVTSPGP